MEDTGIVQNVEILRMSEEGTEAKTAEPLPAERQEAEEKIQTVLLTAEEVEIPETVPTVEGDLLLTELRLQNAGGQVPLQKVIHLILEEIAILIVPGAEGITESPDMNEDYDPYDIPDREEAQNPNTYAEFEKQQQRRRQMDIENMADLDPEDYDEWEDK